MDIPLNQEQELLLQTVRSFMKEEIFPHEEEVDKIGEVPLEIGKQIEKRAMEVGLYSANLPESVGGGGLDYTCMALLEREYGKTRNNSTSHAPLLANMQGIDERVIRASRSLGANGFTSFRRIYFPLTLPGIFSASLLVFIISMGFYITPAILGGGKVLMVAEYISVQLLVTLKWGIAAMLATLMLAGVFALIYMMSRFSKVGDVFGGR